MRRNRFFRLNLVLLFFVFFIAGCGIQERPVGWWKFDEDTGLVAVNSGSRGPRCDGVLNNMDENNRVAQMAGGFALSFDGKEEDVAVGAINLYSNTATITAWIKPDGKQASYAGIVFCRDGDTIAGLGSGSSGEPEWKANNELYYGWNDDEATWAWHSGLIIPDGEWVFVGLVVEEMRATLYMLKDGVLRSAVNETGHDIEEFNGVLRIGNDMKPGYAPRYFRGQIDDVRIYNRALPEAEIRRIVSGRE